MTKYSVIDIPYFNDIINPRKEVRENNFAGVIFTHKVDSNENTIETKPAEFMKISYPSQAIKNALMAIDKKIQGESNQGSFKLVGSYGSGKTHSLILLYHLFNNPKLANDWLRGWRIDVNFPENSRSVILSSQNFSGDHLWGPIFKMLGREDILEEIDKYPLINQIKEVVGEEVTAIFIDEIENWYGSFDPKEQSHLIEQNETFIQHLLEVGKDKNSKLLVFITFLEEKPGLQKIIERTKPYPMDVSSVNDRQKVILYRLFENSEDIDKDKIIKIVDKYIEGYTTPISIGNRVEFQQEMIQSYPFHPSLLKNIFEIFEASIQFQEKRGMLNLLAETVYDTINKKDLILNIDIDVDQFYAIDADLLNKYKTDCIRVQDIQFAEEIIKSILIYTLNEKKQSASETDIIYSVLSPTKGQKINDILNGIGRVYGVPYYLHRNDDGTYSFKKTYCIHALIDREKVSVKENDIFKKCAEILKEKVFKRGVLIYNYDKIPDNKELTIVASLESWGSGDDLKQKFTDFYTSKKWQNTYLLVFPKESTALTFEVRELLKSILATERIKDKVKDEERKVRRIMQENIRTVVDKLNGLYGKVYKWILEEEGVLRPRPINVTTDIKVIKNKIASDPDILKEFIEGQIKDKPIGVELNVIKEDIKKFRRNPFVVNDPEINRVIKDLLKERKIVIKTDRGKIYTDKLPRSIDDNHVLIHPGFLPRKEPEEEDEEKATTSETHIENSDGQTLPPDREGFIIDRPVADTGPITGDREKPGFPIGDTTEVEEKPQKEEKLLEIEGNTTRFILGRFEQITVDSDEFKDINLAYIFEKNLSKQELIKIIKKLPQQENSKIKVKITTWREKY